MEKRLHVYKKYLGTCDTYRLIWLTQGKKQFSENVLETGSIAVAGIICDPPELMDLPYKVHRKQLQNLLHLADLLRAFERPCMTQVILKMARKLCLKLRTKKNDYSEELGEICGRMCQIAIEVSDDESDCEVEVWNDSDYEDECGTDTDDDQEERNKKSEEKEEKEAANNQETKKTDNFRESQGSNSSNVTQQEFDGWHDDENEALDSSDDEYLSSDESIPEEGETEVIVNMWMDQAFNSFSSMLSTSRFRRNKFVTDKDIYAKLVAISVRYSRFKDYSEESVIKCVECMCPPKRKISVEVIIKKLNSSIGYFHLTSSGMVKFLEHLIKHIGKAKNLKRTKDFLMDLLIFKNSLSSSSLMRKEAICITKMEYYYKIPDILEESRKITDESSVHRLVSWLLKHDYEHRRRQESE